MKITNATCVINGLLLMEAKIDTINLAPKLHASYALLAEMRNPENPEATTTFTHGKCTAYPSNWSQRTLDLLNELIESMETDLLPRHFDIGNQEDTDASGLGYREEEGSPQV